ncbi:hypothetical protein BpHYR1_026673 [Brachionus plicatilis]|uniref:Uncharacterized protein n=1 Tax=Brachionus plicatilis TaxID=10195 RepID=A0A3M7Q338_BRAPC|nr:hypothetical protein BpHYR1_026673 [Brachionus plicatilis]
MSKKPGAGPSVHVDETHEMQHIKTKYAQAYLTISDNNTEQSAYKKTLVIISGQIFESAEQRRANQIGQAQRINHQARLKNIIDTCGKAEQKRVNKNVIDMVQPWNGACNQTRKNYTQRIDEPCV